MIDVPIEVPIDVPINVPVLFYSVPVLYRLVFQFCSGSVLIVGKLCSVLYCINNWTDLSKLNSKANKYLIQRERKKFTL